MAASHFAKCRSWSNLFLFIQTAPLRHISAPAKQSASRSDILIPFTNMSELQFSEGVFPPVAQKGVGAGLFVWTLVSNCEPPLRRNVIPKEPTLGTFFFNSPILWLELLLLFLPSYPWHLDQQRNYLLIVLHISRDKNINYRMGRREGQSKITPRITKGEGWGQKLTKKRRMINGRPFPYNSSDVT